MRIMKTTLLICIFQIIQNGYSQKPKASLEQYYSFCETVSDFADNEQKILSIKKRENKWIINAIIRGDCNIRLYPKHEISGDTLKIKTVEIVKYSIKLEDDEEWYEVSQAEECSCLYDMKMQFYQKGIKHLVINDKLKKFDTFEN